MTSADRVFRRRFHRPAEIVIGYDEAVLDPRAVAEAQALWTAGVAVRTMPFRRAEADPAAPLLVTFGNAVMQGAEASPPPPAACRALAAALEQARLRPLHLMVRLDIGDTIVRGDARSDRAEVIAAALAGVPSMARLARQALEQGLPADTHLITAAYSKTGGGWTLRAAHGFRGNVWEKRPDASGRWVNAAEG